MDECGYDVLVQDGKSALVVAAEKGDALVVEQLLSQGGADPNQLDEVRIGIGV